MPGNQDEFWLLIDTSIHGKIFAHCGVDLENLSEPLCFKTAALIKRRSVVSVKS